MMGQLGIFKFKAVLERLTHSLATKYVTFTALIVIAAAFCAFAINTRVNKIEHLQNSIDHFVYVSKSHATMLANNFLELGDLDVFINHENSNFISIEYAGIFTPIHTDSNVLTGQSLLETPTSNLSENSRLKRFAGYVRSKNQTLTLQFNDSFVVGTPVNDNEIYLIVAQHKDLPFFSSLFNTNNMIILLVLLGLSVPLTMVIGKRTLGPLQHLTQATTLAAEGFLDIEFEAKSNDEIGKLAHSFQHMIENLRKMFTKVNELAFIDSITGLHSRQSMTTQLAGTIQKSALNGSTGVLFYIDLDGFKEVNDSYGHDKGDDVLREFASRLKNFFIDQEYNLEAPGLHHGQAKIFSSNYEANNVVLARLGGDEFTAHITSIMSTQEAEILADNMITMLKQPFYINSRPITLGASIGISFFPSDGSTVTDIIKSADIAMYRAKDSGKNTYCIYTPEMNDLVIERMEIGNDLREAIKNDEFIVYFQPLINSKDHSLKSVEALVRWQHPTNGMVPPGKFIPIAEEIGLISDIGNIVLTKACQQSKLWLDNGFAIPIGVNVSNLQFEDQDFPDYVISVLSEIGLPAKFLEIEITESSAMSGTGAFVKSLEPLRQQGIKFAIDDFGTGFSNIAQFMKMKFDTVKLDQSFIREIHNKKDARTVTSTLLGMAKNLKIKTVAEGVETKEDLEILTKMGCDVIQGYYFARPMPADEFLFWLKQHNQALKPSKNVKIQSVNHPQLKIA